jgi:hypothetical protein
MLGVTVKQHEKASISNAKDLYLSMLVLVLLHNVLSLSHLPVNAKQNI